MTRLHAPLIALSLLCVSGVAAAESPKLLTHFQRETTRIRAYGEVRMGYELRVRVAVAFDKAETDDQLHANFKIGKRIKVKCKLDRSGRAVYRNDWLDAKKDVKANVFECVIDKRMKKAGRASVSFDYTSSDEEKTYKNISTLKFEIKRGKTHFAASQDNIAGPVFFVYDPASMRDSGDKEWTKLWFWTRVKLDPSKPNPRENKVRCKLNGKKVFQKDVKIYGRYDVSGQFKMYEVLVWATHHLDKNLGDPGLKRYPFGDHPGTYECRISMDGTTVRKWSFKVGADKRIEDACGPALGMDSAHGVFTSNKATGDYKLKKTAAKKNLFWLPKTPKQCTGLL